MDETHNVGSYLSVINGWVIENVNVTVLLTAVANSSQLATCYYYS